MNIEPDIWGNKLWNTLHIITYVYPENPTEEDKNRMKTLFDILGGLLPCDKCKNNYKKHILKYPLTENILNDRIKLIKWLIDIHNEVNTILNKKILSYDEAIKKIESEMIVNNKSNDKTTDKTIENYKRIIYILIGIIVILIIIMIRKNN